MTEEIRDLIENPEVDTLLRELLSRVQVILGEQFVGLYLYGSLATGSFNPNRSDIDFAVISNSDLPDETVSKLEHMHADLAASGIPWASKLEGSYVPRYAIRRHDPHHPPFPIINEGQFYVARQGSDWIIQRKILRDFGATLAGPPLRNAIDPVSGDDLRDSVRTGLIEWWQPMVEEPSRLERPEYQPYAVLSMCRALYTFEIGDLNSKDDAANWALQELESEWGDLVQEARDWKRGDPIGNIDRTVDFIRYTIARSNERV